MLEIVRQKFRLPESVFTGKLSADDSWTLETTAFADDVRLGREPSPGLQEGIRTLEIVERFYHKAEGR